MRMGEQSIMYDVCIIGAGVTGCAIARELSRYRVSVCVVERCEDVCCGTSKANSAIVHAGYDAANGSLMAQLNVKGNAMMEALSRELDFPFSRNGSLVTCLREADIPGLETLLERGIKNGVTGLRILSREEVHALEPNLSDAVAAALYAPTGGIVCPFLLTIALAENAAVNGVTFRFDTAVTAVRRENGQYILNTRQGQIKSRFVVNAAGVYADVFHNMVSEDKIRITPRRGEYCLLDRTAGGHVRYTIFTLPTERGKGVLVTPTVHGNLLAGPTAADIADKEGTNTTRGGLNEVMEKAAQVVRDIPFRQTITSFSGLRAHEDGHDFIIGEPTDAPGFIDAAGIESPGLTAAPAVGVMVADLLRERLCLQKNDSFQAERRGILRPADLSVEEQSELIRRNPAYGTIVCRCESVTEGEIIDAIRRPVGARSLDGVKRRTRAGMGRCQSGFCSPRVMEILARELDIPTEAVTKSGGGSHIVVNRTGKGGQEGTAL